MRLIWTIFDHITALYWSNLSRPAHQHALLQKDLRYILQRNSIISPHVNGQVPYGRRIADDVRSWYAIVTL